MSKYRCVIVDDEPIARDIIASYCAHLSDLEVAGSCSNALEAKNVLAEGKIDILFLDINMPVISGISFLKTLRNPPAVIFTTAYKEFAVDAFELAAVDYLLKPFALERFIIAVDRAINHVEKKPLPGADKAVPGNVSIFIRADGKIYKILQSDLLYAEASGNYTKMVTTNGTLMPAMTFTNAEDILPRDIFVRVHRSFIINRHRISHIEGNRVYINKTEIPIGTNYKEAFLKELGL